VSSRPSSVGPAPAAGGFSAQLKGASLFDLIQFECASRGRKVVRVTSQGKSALIYFADGRIVHAVAGRTVGEPAVREALTWGQGTFARFDDFDGAWPRAESITASAESVLLRAAQFLDERTGKVVPLPVREPPPRPAPPPTPAPLAAGELAMRLSPAGEVIERQGAREHADADGFCDAVAYAAQLTDLVAELFGLEPFSEVELSFQTTRCVMARQPDRSLLAVRAGGQRTLEQLRRQLGLG
jgi:hypothetical protein